MISQPFIQNEIDDYYIKQAEGQQGGSISDYYENQGGGGPAFIVEFNIRKATVLVVFWLQLGVSFY